MGGNLRSWWGFGAAIVLAVHPAQAGDRKSGAGREARASVHPMVAPVRAAFSADHHAPIGKVEKPGEVAYFPVRPLEARLVSSGRASAGDRQQEEERSTSRRERKGLTLFRVNPKFGDISVQPVIGGVNGAQISVGF